MHHMLKTTPSEGTNNQHHDMQTRTETIPQTELCQGITLALCSIKLMELC